MHLFPILLQPPFILHCVTVVPGQASLCLLLLHQTASFNVLRICSCIPDPTGWHPLWFPLQAVDLIDELMVRPVRIIVDNDHVKEVAIFIFHFTSLFNYIFEFILLKNHHYHHYHHHLSQTIYRVSQEECARLRESVPYVKLYRYNTKHLYPKLNGYGDNGQRSLKLWQLLFTYWLPNTYWNWQEYVVSVMLISVLNIKLTCEWHKAIKFNYKNTRTTVVFVLRFPSNLCRPQLVRYLAKVTALWC